MPRTNQEHTPGFFRVKPLIRLQNSSRNSYLSRVRGTNLVWSIVYGTPPELEGLPQAFPGLVPDLPLSGCLGGRAGLVSADQQENRQSAESTADRFGNRRPRRP